MPNKFSDRSEHLFGRANQVRYIVDRSRVRGLTLVWGRPKMGKTWTLTEAARHMIEDEGLLIGYHESTGAESSHLLYAVADLYANWLSDSTMLEQARIAWDQHQTKLIPRLGKAIGSLFRTLATASGDVLAGSIVRKTFDGLAELQQDLTTGSISLEALPFDQALTLTKLVSQISNRRTVLILDAWEKSPTLQSEYRALETYLGRLDDWPETHVILGIRNPDLEAGDVSTVAFQRARDLRLQSAEVELYELPPMDLSRSDELERLIRYLRINVPGASQFPDDGLLALIDGYPSVIDRWLNTSDRTRVATGAGITELAKDAISLRYRDLEARLADVQDLDQRSVSARVAFLPRINEATWSYFRKLFVEADSDRIVETLKEIHLFDDDARFPTYGHDTRHIAAREWFIREKKPSSRRLIEELVLSLAAKIDWVEEDSAPLILALLDLSGPATDTQIDPAVRSLISAAFTLVGIHDEVMNGAFDRNYPEIIIRDPSVVPLLALAIMNRAIGKHQRGEIDGELSDYDALSALPNAPVRLTSRARINRGILIGKRGAITEELTEYTAVIDGADSPPEQIALALNNRAFTKKEIGDTDGAIADYTSVIERVSSPRDLIDKALVSRGALFARQKLFARAVDDYTHVFESPESSAEQRSRALFNRALAARDAGDLPRSLTDCTTLIELDFAPPYFVARALLERSRLRRRSNDDTGADQDLRRLVSLNGVPAELKAAASAELRFRMY